ncbi:tail tip assembly protein [Escherichia phage PGN590]|uniref:Tail tip assembly protein n=1 Tax=Escherichia phage PGN590 TaxID=2714735 RepID=A0A6M9EF87_9CAUD|nr:tail tip assembly protein [Escherichia phage PGN590]QKL16958.1 tail tip assembly protein [Escherichia phage PGN590]
MMKQLIVAKINACMIPHWRGKLKDNHITRFWRLSCFNKTLFQIIFLIKIFTVLRLPPFIWFPEVIQDNAMLLMPCHNKPPAIIRPKRPWATNQRTRFRLNDSHITFGP